MKFLLWPMACLALVMSLVFGQAHALDETLTADVDLLVHELMDAYDVPGFSLAIVKDGEILYAQGYGVRSVATGELVTPETQFSIGSISKSFTALAAAQLVDQGLLDLDAPIIEYLPDFTLSDPAMTEKLTLRHLLSNSGGFIPDDIAWYGGEQVKTRAEVPGYIGTLTMAGEPGSLYAYNNLGYTLAGIVVETVAGQPWETYVAEHIFAPLGMTTASTDYETMQTTQNYFVPHRLDVREGMLPLSFFPYLPTIAPAGAINANALDMANYMIFQLGDGTFEGQHIISEALLDEMHTAHIESYGLGWVTADYEKFSSVFHDGALDGFGALLAMIPSENLGVIGMMNSDYIENAGFLDVLIRRVAETVLEIEPEEDALASVKNLFGWTPVERAARLEAVKNFTADPATYELLTGDYDSVGREITVSVREGLLWVTITTQGYVQEAELIEFEPGKFIGNMRGLTNSIFTFKEGRRGVTTLYQDHIPVGQRPG